MATMAMGDKRVEEKRPEGRYEVSWAIVCALNFLVPFSLAHLFRTLTKLLGMEWNGDNGE